MEKSKAASLIFIVYPSIIPLSSNFLILSATDGGDKFTNAILDGIISIVLASNFSIGIIISSFILIMWQGLIYLSSNIVSVYITPDLLNEISIIGGILILGSGLNILEIKKIKVLKLLPALLIPIIFFIAKNLI